MLVEYSMYEIVLLVRIKSVLATVTMEQCVVDYIDKI